eukprot:1690868-Pleurochrysis_carterae.AAC.2
MAGVLSATTADAAQRCRRSSLGAWVTSDDDAAARPRATRGGSDGSDGAQVLERVERAVARRRSGVGRGAGAMQGGAKGGGR